MHCQCYPCHIGKQRNEEPFSCRECELHYMITAHNVTVVNTNGVLRAIGVCPRCAVESEAMISN